MVLATAFRKAQNAGCSSKHITRQAPEIAMNALTPLLAEPSVGCIYHDAELWRMEYNCIARSS